MYHFTYTAEELADRWGVPEARVTRWAKEGRFVYRNQGESRGVEWRRIREGGLTQQHPFFSPAYIYALEDRFGILPGSAPADGDIPAHHLVVTANPGQCGETVEVRTTGDSLAERMVQAADEAEGGVNERRGAALAVLYAAAERIHGRRVAVPPPKRVLAEQAAELAPRLFSRNGEPLSSDSGETFSRATYAAGIPFQSGQPHEKEARRFWRDAIQAES